MAAITLRRDGKTLQRHVLRAGTTSVGRQSGNDIVLSDPSVSRRHASFALDEENHALVRDLGSSNGILVNGAAVPYRELQHGDTVAIGRFELVVDLQATPPSSRAHTVQEVAEAPPEGSIVRRRKDAVPLGEKRLRFLYEVSSQIASTLHENELLANLMDRIFEVFEVGRGALALLDPETGKLDYREVRNASEQASGAVAVSRGIVDCVLKEKTAVLVKDAMSDDRYAARMSIMRQRIRSVLCVPILAQQKLLGLVYLDDRRSRGAFSEEDLEFLSILCGQVAQALESARLHEAELAMQRIAGELEIAQGIQQGLLPRGMPDVPGWELCGRTTPTREVGGDYYDVVALDGGRVGLLIADVAGKGIAAALLMANAQATFRNRSLEIDDPAELICKMNDHVTRNFADDRFITLFYGILDPATGAFRYCNAGHNDPYVLRPGGRVEMTRDGDGPPLGIVGGYPYEGASVDLGDALGLFFYTDGVTEAVNEAEELYGIKRLERVLKTLSGDAGTWAGTVFDDVGAFTAGAPQADDITVLVAARRSRTPDADDVDGPTQPVSPTTV